MKLCDELRNRVENRIDMENKPLFYTNYEKEELFHALRKEADKGKNSYTIYDYVLSYPHLVNNKLFNKVLADEGLTIEYVKGSRIGSYDCIVRW